MTPRPSVVAGRTKFRYSDATVRIPEGSAPPTYQRSHTITANLVIPDDGAEGVIVACGGSAAGYTLYVRDGKLTYDYNFFGKQLFHFESSDVLPTGQGRSADGVRTNAVQAVCRFPWRPGQVAGQRQRGRWRRNWQFCSRTIFGDRNPRYRQRPRCPVSSRYRSETPFAFTGTINNVTVEISPTQPFKQ